MGWWSKHQELRYCDLQEGLAMQMVVSFANFDVYFEMDAAHIESVALAKGFEEEGLRVAE
jgi:hypothetical protein